MYMDRTRRVLRRSGVDFSGGHEGGLTYIAEEKNGRVDHKMDAWCWYNLQIVDS